MPLTMRRLHPRGAANRGICVDSQEAMLGPDCVLVRRTPRGFRPIERSHAAALQKCTLAEGHNPDWLFHQSRRIAEALDQGEVALAQIYGLHIPVIEFDDHRLARIAQIDFARGYDPDEPRIPKGDPHGGEWTTGEALEAEAGSSTDDSADSADGGADSSDSGDDGSESNGDNANDSGEGSNRPAGGESPSGIPQASAVTGDQDHGKDTGPADDSISYKWPDQSSPASAPPAQPPSADSGPSTLGSPDLGDGASNAPPPDSDQSPPQDSTAASAGSEPGNTPPPDIPATQPSTTRQINAVLRSLATWLGRALVVLGAVYELDPRVRMVLAAIEAAAWLAKYSPKIFSYLDAPKTLAELQNAATRPAPPGYEIHHIVEVLRGSKPQSNADRFPDLIESRENLVRVPYWKHVEISAWYSRKNAALGDITPRDYLRDKTWSEQYSLGLKVLRLFGVLK